MDVRTDKSNTLVLIVAKCNVNIMGRSGKGNKATVLIVAKCNVNKVGKFSLYTEEDVLIVAKCNVNQSLIYLQSYGLWY